MKVVTRAIRTNRPGPVPPNHVLITMAAKNNGVGNSVGYRACVIKCVSVTDSKTIPYLKTNDESKWCVFQSFHSRSTVSLAQIILFEACQAIQRERLPTTGFNDCARLSGSFAQRLLRKPRGNHFCHWHGIGRNCSCWPALTVPGVVACASGNSVIPFVLGPYLHEQASRICLRFWRQR